MQRGKRLDQVAERIDSNRAYPPEEAVRLVKELSSTRFDETVEVHLRTAADARHADQQVRSVVVLPHGRGKPVRLVAFAVGEAATIAREAGADYVGDDDLIQRVEKGWTDFDVAVATPDMMGRIGKLGRYLGRRGLMPNPRTGTVVQPADLPRVVAEARKGRVEYRLDRTGNIHLPIGRVSFAVEQLLENLATAIDSVMRARPSAVKGQFLRGVHLSSSMGPGIKLDPNAAMALRAE